MNTPQEPTIADLVPAFLADIRPDLADHTYKDRERVSTRFVRAFGERVPSSLRPSEVKAWIFAQKQWTMPTTRWNVLNNLKQLFNWAINDSRILCSPIRGLKLPMGNPRRPVTEEEFQAMLRHSRAVFRRVLIFLRHTGCRPGEARALLWEWIDRDRGIVRIPPAFHKTGKRTRKPKIIALSAPSHKLLLWLWRRRHCAHVFTSTRNKPWTRIGFTKRLLQIRTGSGLPREVCLHGLRHLFGTMAIRRGASLKMVSKALGHASTNITEKFYVNLDDEIEGMREAAAISAKRPQLVQGPVRIRRLPGITSKGAAL